MNDRTIVIIPLYKSELNEFEEISLKQAFSILRGYQIVFVCPQSLNFDFDLCSDDYSVERFDDKYFASVAGYNELMLSVEYYNRFKDYEYMLIVQLDAFVFSDELERFCNMNYDYIGAPWIHGARYYRDVHNIIHYVGNGGLSLRKISSFIDWLTNHRFEIEDLIGNVNEDNLIGIYGKDYMNIASFEDALSFAFDFDPRKSYELNGNKLPFGIHAWQKYDLDFCRPFIEQCGYIIPEVDNSEALKKYEYRYQYEEIRNSYLDGLVNKGTQIVSKLLKDESDELYIWGTGQWGKFVGRIFNDLDIDYKAFIDNNKKSGSFLNHVIISSDEWFGTYTCDKKVVIAVFEPDEIAKQLDEKGMGHLTDYLVLTDF